MLTIERKNKELFRYLTRMTEMVDESVSVAVDTLLSGNLGESNEVINSVLKNDKNIDEIEKVIDRKALELLVLINPYASDFRFVFSVTKISSNLERIADECKNVVKTFPTLKDEIPQEMLNMAKEVKEVYRACVKDLLAQDVSNASERIKKDAQIDAMELMVISKFPDSVPYALLAKALERIGDHCTNIIEEFVYAYEGTDLSDVRQEAKISEK